MGDTPFERVLSSYQHLGNQAYNAACSVTQDDVHDYLHWFLLDIPVVPILITFHTLFAASKVYSITPARTFWLKSLVLTTMAAFGGSTLAAVLSARPAPLFTVSSNVMMCYIVCAWYAVHRSRMLRLLLSSRPVSAVLAFGATAAKARAIFGFMDDYVGAFPRAAAGAIVLGGVAGSGGQLFVSLEHIAQRGLHASSELSAPGWGLKSAFAAAAAYYAAVDPDDVLYDLGLSLFDADRTTARLYISMALCVHAAVETMYGAHLNPLFWLDAMFYALTGLGYGVKAGAYHQDNDQSRSTPSSAQGMATGYDDDDRGAAATTERAGYNASARASRDGGGRGDFVTDGGLRRRR